jgi:hypothetical protein
MAHSKLSSIGQTSILKSVKLFNSPNMDSSAVTCLYYVSSRNYDTTLPLSWCVFIYEMSLILGEEKTFLEQNSIDCCF